MAEPQSLHEFLRKHSHAWQFASKASADYLLTRLGMVNGMWSSFEMATQAIEKLLKSYLLFTNPTLRGDAEEVRKAVSRRAKAGGRTSEFGHDVEAALELARESGLPCSSGLAARIAHINAFYTQRYPDAKTLKSLDTGDLNKVDNALFEIWDGFKPLHLDYYYITGIMTPVYGLYSGRLSQRQQIANQKSASAKLRTISQNRWAESIHSREYGILTQSNAAYATRRADLEGGILERLRAWHPQWFSSAS